MQSQSVATTKSIVEVSMENAQAVLVEASATKPVLSFFWSPSSPACIALKTILEQMAVEFSGKFILALVNTDEMAGIATQLGVSSLPTVIVMQSGQPVDGLVGEQNAASIRTLLEKFLPPQWQEDMAKAQGLLDSGSPDDQAKAIMLLKMSFDKARHSATAIMLADIYLSAGRLDECDATLKRVPLQDRQSSWGQVESSLQLKREAGKAPEIVALEKLHAETPEDLTLVQQLAVALAQEKHHAEALDLLFSVLKKDLGASDGAIRKTFQEILSSLGKGDALAVRFQRQLYALIY